MTVTPGTVTLAPMEGVVDAFMRDMMTRIGGYDLCVTEFIRVSNNMIYPPSMYYKFSPELLAGGKTPGGTPVHIQLMGGDANLLAENAAFVCTLGAPGIDLNFGCPAKTVNRRDAGSTLLQWPERVHGIVSAVRRAVPDGIPVSAKMRLGYLDKSLAIENAQAVEAAGAVRLAVHARTKLEGYKPPAHWDWISRICEAVTLPVIANGEIWTREDAIKCREVSGCKDLMIGRGAIGRPDLAQQIQDENFKPLEWSEVINLLPAYYDLMKDNPNTSGTAGRLKQWIKLLARSYPEAKQIFMDVRRYHEPEKIIDHLQRSLILEECA